MVSIISEKQVDLGIYVNADNIKKELQETRHLNFDTFSFSLDLPHLKREFKASSLFIRSNGIELSEHLDGLNNRLFVSDNYLIDDYFTAFLA